MLCAYVIGLIAWPGPAGSALAWASHDLIVLRAGPGLDILFAGRAGPHNSICGPGPGRVSTTAAVPGRAWASNHICGPGLGLDFRPVQDTNTHTETLAHAYARVDAVQLIRGFHTLGPSRQYVVSWDKW